MKRILRKGSLTLTILAPEQPASVIYIPCPDRVPKGTALLAEEFRTALVFLTGVDWNNDLSPWPAEGLCPGETFRGNGPGFLRFLEEAIFPEAEREMGNPALRYAAGVSMAGLFALWAAAEKPLFDGIASLSGSLWFDGFLPYLETCAFPPRLQRVYLSLGNREKRARNRRLASVQTCTGRTEELLRARNIPVVFQKNQGNHFDFPEERLEEALRYLLTGNVWKGPHSL